MAKSQIKDFLSFTSNFFKSPRLTGSLVPSSSFLGKKMAKAANIKANKIVLELGPGTGPVTAQILASGIDSKLLYCIEFDTKLCEILERRFPEVNILNASAENICSLIPEQLKDLCAIVSSLPLVSLPKPLTDKILSEVENALPKGGRFVQFTYNFNRKPEDLNFRKMRHIGHSKVILNIPPARVDVFEKL